jgi:hypothetical protein
MHANLCFKIVAVDAPHQADLVSYFVNKNAITPELKTDCQFSGIKEFKSPSRR